MKLSGAPLAILTAAAFLSSSAVAAAQDARPQTRPVQLARLVAKFSRGEKIGRYKIGYACLLGDDLTWKGGGRQDLDTREFDDVFRTEIRKLGFNVAGDPDNLFETGNDSAEYLVGGTIDALDMKLCFPMGGFGDWDSSKGRASVEVSWQIYSVLDHRVVGTIKTTGSAEDRKTRNGGMYSILMKAFAESVHQLAASDMFRTTFTGPPTDLTVARTAPTGLQPIQFLAASKAHPNLGDAVGSTVLVMSGVGHGSGFLIGTDGMILTNAHVVGSAAYLKIRWSDGVETLGEVARVDKARDVALIKSDARNRPAFHIRTTPATVGEDVYAIGAPLDPKLQSSVTKGIVSANRVLDGLSYIQSDVTVNPGNSGGPLLDANRNVIGITVSGLDKSGVPLGINLFIPIKDAEDFLAVRPKSQ